MSERPVENSRLPLSLAKPNRSRVALGLCLAISTFSCAHRAKGVAETPCLGVGDSQCERLDGERTVREREKAVEELEVKVGDLRARIEEARKGIEEWDRSVRNPE